VQVVGREIRPEVRTVAINGPVLHEAISKECLLTGANILPVKTSCPEAETTRAGTGGLSR
jgi:hypothetical protein